VSGRLLTARAVSERLDVSPETVLRWARAGELPAVHLSNRAIRFPEDALEAWLQQRTTPARGSVTHPAGRRPPGNVLGVTHPKHEEF
jgi:excisionase family DNA binding protein